MEATTAGGGHGHEHGHAGHGHHGHHDHRARVDRLLSEERARTMPPGATLRAAGLATGMTVVDLGCGPGFLTLAARAIVGPAGRVIAADVDPRMLDHLRGRLDGAGVADVQVVEVVDGRVPVADGVADVVLAALVLHEVDDPAGFLAECARLARPGGVVSVIEIRHEDDRATPVAHRISVARTTDLAARAGLVRHEVADLSDDRVLVRLRRAGA